MRSVEVFVHGAYPGAVALLDDLTLRGVTLACLSNTNLRHWEIMSAWNAPEDAVMSRINVRLGSHEVASRKPDPEVYRQLELATGASRDRIVFFDDLADNVAAANARGWRAFQVTSKDDPISQIRAQLVALEIL